MSPLFLTRMDPALAASLAPTDARTTDLMADEARTLVTPHTDGTKSDT